MFLLHLHYIESDLRQTLNFESAFRRALHMIRLAPQLVKQRTEDIAPVIHQGTFPTTFVRL